MPGVDLVDVPGLVGGRHPVHQHVEVLELVRDVDLFDHHVTRLPEFWVQIILHLKPFGNF